MRLLLAALCLAIVLPAVPSRAQTQAQGQEDSRPLLSLIVTIDQERMFLKSLYGQSLITQVEQDAAALAAENRKIEAELEAEELQLTQDRDGMPPEEFHQKAAAFDEKVVGIRAAQDAKARQIVRARDELQQAFFQQVLPILTEVVRERGAVVVLDARSVVLSAGQIDVTADAIERIDARLAPAEDAQQEATPAAPPKD